MSALLVGDPADGALEACAALGPGGTLAWGSADALRAASDRLAELGWDALLVDPTDESLATGAMSLLAQTRGHAEGLTVYAGAGPVQPVFDEALMVVRHLPVVPVVLTGPGAAALAAPWAEPTVDLELAPPRVVAVDELAEAWGVAPGQDTKVEDVHG